MTTLLSYVKAALPEDIVNGRVNGANYDEVLFADDTIFFSTMTKHLNSLLKAVEEEGGKYGLKLNKTKCEAMVFNGPANVHFADDSKVPIHTMAKYLGCHLNLRNDTDREVRGKTKRQQSS